MDRRRFLLALPPSAIAVNRATAAPPAIVFDAAKPGNAVRPLHGVNGGPLAAGGILDVSAKWKEAKFSTARLHDCHWPIPDVVDMHAVFPDATADPDKPESYDFERTDEFVKAILDSGTNVIYRLGESIEHQKAKRRSRPPKNPERWAAACVGIIRHYTEGWANGFKYPIRHWEIWNEPDNRPSCWTGTDDEYFQLYAVTAKALKARFPKLLIGGPGLGNTGKIEGDRIEPTPFLKLFLTKCRDETLPLDFLSWHCYTGDPKELARRATGMRRVLDAAGFKAAESHLNEWNYLPGGDWSGMMSKDATARHRWHDRLAGPEGAAFVTAALTLLQDTPLDMANYFSAEAQGMGLFSVHGLPLKTYHAFRAFQELAGLPRLPAVGALPNGVTALAAAEADKSAVLVLLARYAGEGGPVSVNLRQLPWEGRAKYEILGVDNTRDLEQVGFGVTDGEVSVNLPASSVRLIKWRKPS